MRFLTHTTVMVDAVTVLVCHASLNLRALKRKVCPPLMSSKPCTVLTVS